MSTDSMGSSISAQQAGHGRCGVANLKLRGLQTAKCDKCNPASLSGVLLLLILLTVPFPQSQARDLEPRYSWSPNVGLGDFESPDEAFAAYRAWEETNNALRPPRYRVTVLDYIVPANTSTINGRPSIYWFKFQRLEDCPTSCYGNAMSLNVECPLGTSIVSTWIVWGQAIRHACVPTPYSTKPDPDLKSCPVNNPIYPATGLKYQVETDYQSPTGTLSFSRTYRSDRMGWSNSYESFAVDLGNNAPTSNKPRNACENKLGTSSGRLHCFKYLPGGPENEILVRRGGGRVRGFDAWTGVSKTTDVNDRVTRLTDGSGNLVGWNTYNSENDVAESYGVDGNLQTITSRDGKVQTLTYSTASTSSSVAPYSGLLINVTDSVTGQQLNFTYDSLGRMSTMTDPAGAVYTYGYDEASSIVLPGNRLPGNLTSVTFPDQTKRIYWYNEQDKTSQTNLPAALTGISDEAGVRYGTYRYDSQGRAVATEHAGQTQKAVLTYNVNGTTTVADYTDGTGAPTVNRVYTFQDSNGVRRNTAMSRAGASCGSAALSTAYDANGNVSSRVDFAGFMTSYAYDLSRNLETSRTEAFGTTKARTTTTQWHAAFSLPTQVDAPGLRTTFTYDGNGNLLTKTTLETATGASRTSVFTYNSIGQLLTADGPRTDVSDVTTFTYYHCTSGYLCGQVETITNALGQTTRFNSYNAHGQPLTITDPNGVVTTLTYDLRQRLTSRTVGTETSTFEYWPTGLLSKATLSDGSSINYGYDAAHRLVSIADGEGNRIDYTLDAAGNRIKEDVYDLSGALARTRSQVFDALGNKIEDRNASGQSSSYGYDALGNMLAATDPMGRLTTYEYDPLNRLSAVVDPAIGVTSYNYDTQDNLTGVTDPKSLTTSYAYNALGDLKQLTSPDTGVTQYTPDSAGNTTEVRDARNRVAETEYDALGRVTEVEYSDETIQYSYDTGANAKGRLVQVTDGSGATQWTYDSLGRPASKTQTIGSAQFQVGYGYNSAGQLQSIATPSGQLVGFIYINGQVTDVSVNGLPVLNQALYAPFGPTLGWRWADGTFTVREYDTDGRPVLIDSGGVKAFTYHPDGTIASQTDDAPPSTTDSGVTDFAVSQTSNRIDAAAGLLTRNYTYDAAGNTISDGNRTFTYNSAGRMMSASLGAVTTNYAYNALGQRVRKSNASGTTYFVYDEAGHLLGEYDSTGALIQELVWLGDIPVASIRPNENGTGVGVFFIHTDHLNAPTKLTRSTDGAIVWRWDHDPFGNGVPNEDPDGNGLFVVFNLRFPGQYFDSETGLHYNYYRDGYDPAVGRYTQSDPIGLGGGVNTYAYVGGNPVSLADPSGLCPWCLAIPAVCAGGGCEAGLAMLGLGAAMSTPAGQQAAKDTASAISEMMSTPSDTKDGAVCKPAIADVQPNDLCEQLALAEAKAGAGVPIMSALADEPRLIALYGWGPWIKKQHTHVCANGRKVVIHYFTNGRGSNVELKIK